MSRYTYDGNTSFWWLTAVDDVEAITVDEIEAGVDISSAIPKDGFKPGTSNTRVKNDDITTAFDAELPGTWSAPVELTIIRDDETDDAYDELKIRGTEGFLVVRDAVAYSTAIAAAQVVDVYPATTMTPRRMDTAGNERVKVVIDLAITAEPGFDVAVVDGS